MLVKFYAKLLKCYYSGDKIKSAYKLQFLRKAIKKDSHLRIFKL